MAQQQTTLDFLVSAHVAGMEEMAKLINRVDALEKATRSLKSANDGLEKSTESIIRNGTRYNNMMDAQSKAMRQARQGSQQLTMQVNDFFTSISTGASPAQAFNQQIGQVGYALSMMEGRLGAVGRILSGPLGIALMLGTMGLSQMGGEADKTGGKMEKLGAIAGSAVASIGNKIMNGLAPAIEGLSPLIEGVKIAFVAMAQGVLAVVNRIIGATIGVINGTVIAIKGSFSAILDMGVGLVNAFVRITNSALAKTENVLNLMSGSVNLLLSSVGISTRIATVSLGRLEEVTNRWAGSAIGTAKAVGNAFMSAFRTDVIDINSIMSGANVAGEAASGAGRGSRASKKAEDNAAAIAQSIAEINMKADKEWRQYWAKAEEDQMIGLQEKLKDMQTMAEATVETVGQSAGKIFLDRAIEIQNAFGNIGLAVNDAFKGMLSGAMSWKDGIKGIIQSVINELWRLYVVQQIVGFVTKALGGATGNPGPDMGITVTRGRAVGGYVAAQTPYMVGEKGPELFVPGGSGTIIPNKNMGMGGGGGGGVTVNVDARGSADPAAVRAQVEAGILQAAPAIIAAAEARTVQGLRRPRLGGAMK